MVRNLGPAEKAVSVAVVALACLLRIGARLYAGDSLCLAKVILPILLGVASSGLCLGLFRKHRYQVNKAGRRKVPRSISAVVPTYNERERIGALVSSLIEDEHIDEVVVVDGGSRDGTEDAALEAGARVIQCPRGRGTQLDEGARASTGEVVWMIHADSVIPERVGKEILRCLEDPFVVGGACWKEFDVRHWAFIGNVWRCFPRMLLGGWAFGDQGIFVRRSDLECIGGIPRVVLMEEFKLFAAMRSRGRVSLADTTIKTSARRFLENGILRTYLLMGSLRLMCHFGADPEFLETLYRRGKLLFAQNKGEA